MTSAAPTTLGRSSSPSTTYLPIYVRSVGITHHDISGPKQPGNDIDVFLEPLIEDMNVLWEDGV